MCWCHMIIKLACWICRVMPWPIYKPTILNADWLCFEDEGPRDFVCLTKQYINLYKCIIYMYENIMCFCCDSAKPMDNIFHTLHTFIHRCTLCYEYGHWNSISVYRNMTCFVDFAF